MAEPAYAGFWRRLIAFILDQIILAVGRLFIYGALWGIAYAGLYFAESQNQIPMVIPFFVAAIVLLDLWLAWIYFALCESSPLRGTPGKLALGIRVIHRDRRALTFEEATVRYFAKILSALLFFIGYLLCAFSSRKQALHDFIARAVLVVER
ncbi:MAG: RDD family protein [Turneriella sp.]|nr:RDD family protein [Leptospiraceae bacterium]MCX7633418.1 RDD family protein [Turneriella sp.]